MGAVTPSYDREMEVSERFPVDHINLSLIHEAAKKLTGTILQVPPIHSAIRLNGKRAYELARKGETPELKSREVIIREFEITRAELPEVESPIRTSPFSPMPSISLAYTRSKL